jgi:hypothetical protein
MNVLAYVAKVPSSAVTIDYVKVSESRRRRLLQTTILVGIVIQPPAGTTTTALSIMTASLNTQNIAAAISTDTTGMNSVLPGGGVTVTSINGVSVETGTISIVLILIICGVCLLFVVGIGVLLYLRYRSITVPGAVVEMVGKQPVRSFVSTSPVRPYVSNRCPPNLCHRDEDIFKNIPFALHNTSTDNVCEIDTSNVLKYNMLAMVEIDV